MIKSFATKEKILDLIKEININSIEGFRIGNAHDIKGGTGCTVVICEKGATGGVDVRGGGPATRETDLLSPLSMCDAVYAVMISGGSAFGLDASGGAMRYLEEKGIGFDTGAGYVPIVAGASLFDLITADEKCRPDAKMGYEACVDSEKNEPKMGNQGAGTGATVGKFMGKERLMKGGLGFYAVKTGNLKVGAIVAVNCLGDVYDVDTGARLAGILSEDGHSIDDTRRIMWEYAEKKKNVFQGNTTIGCIITNASLSKAQCNKMASMAHDGYAAVIRPVHTSADGDTIFFMAHGSVEVNQDALGDLCSYVIAKAVNNGVKYAEFAYGFKSANDI